MKEEELRKLSICGVCQEKIGKSGSSLFFKATLELYCLDFNALNKQQGLTMMLGSAKLAEVMGTGEDLANKIDTSVLSVCYNCYEDNLDFIGHFSCPEEKGIQEP
mgnify:CR=1 FL=1